MKEISYFDILKIEYEEYGKKWEGYIFADTPTVDGEDATDDDWELLDPYMDYVWMEDEAGRGGILVKESYIMNEAFFKPALRSNWGYKEPAAGDGLEDCGGEPEYHCVTSTGDDLYLHGEGYVK